MTRRARRTLALVLLGLLLAAGLEIATLVALARWVGPGWTVLLLILDGVVGVLVVKRAGRRAAAALRQRLETGRLPDREVGDGVLVVLAGVLFALPGLLSDVLALLLVVPVTRPLFRGLIAGYAARRVAVRPGVRRGAGPADAAHPGPTVVRGEVIDESSED